MNWGWSESESAIAYEPNRITSQQMCVGLGIVCLSNERGALCGRAHARV